MIAIGHCTRDLTAQSAGRAPERARVELSVEIRLRPLVTNRSPLTGAVSKTMATSKTKWVTPEVLVDISYPNKSTGGHLRHPRFVRLRDDLKPKGEH